MALIGKTPGEIADRLTILELKIENGRRQGKPTEHWQDEYNELLWESISWREVGIAHEMSSLRRINAEIWSLEDVTRGGTPILHRQVQQLNDERMDVIRQINEIFHVESSHMVKI